MKFDNYKEKCPWTSLSMSMLTMCSANGKVCKKDNCGVIYWLDKLKKCENKSDD